LLGYHQCESAAPEEGFNKVAIFCKPNGKPAHAARQLPHGRWTSKLGDWEDIEHALNAVAGSAYGTVVVILRKCVGA